MKTNPKVNRSFKALAALTLAAAGCAPANSNLTVPSVAPVSQQAVTANNTICRSTPQVEAALNGRYTGTLANNSNNGQSQAFDMTFSTMTIQGYTGNFLKVQFNTSGALGSESFEAAICTEALPVSNGTTVYLTSNPITPSNNPAQQVINRAVPYRLRLQSGLNSSNQYDAAQSQLAFFDCGFSGTCANPGMVYGLQITGLRKN